MIPFQTSHEWSSGTSWQTDNQISNEHSYSWVLRADQECTGLVRHIHPHRPKMSNTSALNQIFMCPSRMFTCTYLSVERQVSPICEHYNNVYSLPIVYFQCYTIFLQFACIVHVFMYIYIWRKSESGDWMSLNAIVFFFKILFSVQYMEHWVKFNSKHL